MCIVCVELIKQKLTIPEAEKNLGEMRFDSRQHIETLEHYGRLKDAMEVMDLDTLATEIDKGADYEKEKESKTS